jgi:hypothetical protein
VSRAPRVTKATLDRALKSLTDQGLTLGKMEIRPDGAVIITPLTSNDTVAPPDSLDAWRAKRAGRANQGA